MKLLLPRIAWRLGALSAIIALPSFVAKGEDSVTLPGSLDFLAVKDLKITTTAVFEDENVTLWNGEGLHAGAQSCSFTLYNVKEMPSEFDVPADPAVYCNITDAYGEEIFADGRDIANEFNKFKYMKNYSHTFNFSAGVTRGGEYKLSTGISPDLFSYEQELLIKDEAGARVTGTTTKVDVYKCPIVTITSGYPYDPESVKGEKTLRWSVSPANDPTKILDEQTETFVLDADKPKLAAVAELPLVAQIELEPGEYLYTLTSDFAPACRTFTAYVYDVPTVEVALNKTEYKAGEDTEAILKVDMTYGYPYIAVDANTEQNTIFMTTKLLEESTTNEFSDPAWADADVHCTKELTVSLEKITDEVVSQYKGEVPLSLLIDFNGERQYESNLILPFAYDNSGIESVVVADVVGEYNVSFYLPEEGTSHKGEMTVVAGDADNSLVFNFPVMTDVGERIWEIKATLDSSNGNISITTDQPVFADRYYTSLWECDMNAWEYNELESLTATFNGSEIDFGYNFALMLEDADLEPCYFIFGVFMAKKNNASGIDPNEGWTSLGNATFIDPWVTALFSLDQKDYPYEVELQQNKANPDLYRLVDPYRGNCIMAEENYSFAEHGYIQFNISDPDHVTFDFVEAGYSNPGNYTSKMYCYNTLSWKVLTSGLTPAEVVAQEGDNIPYTTYKDGVVTIGSKSVQNADGTVSTVYDARYGTHWSPLSGEQWENADGSVADMNGSITFPGYNGVESVDADNSNAPETYYNLQGQPVAHPDKGLYIVRKGDKAVKIFK